MRSRSSRRGYAQEKRQRIVIIRIGPLDPRPRIRRKAERGAAELHFQRSLPHDRKRRIFGWPAVVAFHQHRAFANKARDLAMKSPGDRHAFQNLIVRPCQDAFGQ